MVKILGHRVLIKLLDVTEADAVFASAKAAGLELPPSEQMAREQGAVDRGVVVHLGSTAYKDFGEEPWVQKGDEVLISRYAGKKITDPYTKEEFTAVNDEDIIVVITKEQEE